MAKKKRFPVRYLVQIIFFIFISYIAINHLVIRGGADTSATVHAYCPFGAIESLYNNLVHGTFVWKVQYSSYVMLIAVVGISLLFGKGFCGWICPFGSLQEWIRIGGAKLFKQKKSLLPPVVDAKMRYLKYGVVLLIVIPTYITGRMVFENYDPFVAFFHFGKNITRHLQPAYIILGVVLVFSLFIGRFWCRYFCPLGAVLGLLNKISFFSIKRVAESCTNCELCDTKCPVDIKLSNIDRLKSAECIACLESEQACPQKGALLATTFGRNYSLGSYTALLLVFFFLAIGLARLTGYWQTTASRGSAERPPAAQRGRVLHAIPQEEEPKPEGGVELREGVVIRGSMSLEEVAKKVELTHQELCRRLRIPASSSKKLLLKDIMQEYGYSMSQLVEMLRREEQVTPQEEEEEYEGGVELRAGVVIRGSMSLEEVAEKAELTHEELCLRLGIPASTSKKSLLKDTMEKYGYRMNQIIQMLRGDEGEVQIKPRYRKVQPAPKRATGQRQRGGGGIVLKSGMTLRGSMNLQEVAEAVGLTHQQMCRKLNIPSSTPRSLILRDIMSSYGYTMSQIASMLEEP